MLPSPSISPWANPLASGSGRCAALIIKLVGAAALTLLRRDIEALGWGGTEGVPISAVPHCGCDGVMRDFDDVWAVERCQDLHNHNNFCSLECR